MYYWDFSIYENGYPLYFFLEIPERKLVMLFNAWLSFWPGMAFGGASLEFDSELIGRTFPFSDSGYS